MIRVRDRYGESAFLCTYTWFNWLLYSAKVCKRQKPYRIVCRSFFFIVPTIVPIRRSLISRNCTHDIIQLFLRHIVRIRCSFLWVYIITPTYMYLYNHFCEAYRYCCYHRNRNEISLFEYSNPNFCRYFTLSSIILAAVQLSCRLHKKKDYF